MNIVDPIVTGYIFSELYNQVGEGISHNKESHEKMMNYTAAFPINNLSDNLPEGIKDKMVPVGLVRVNATFVMPHHIVEESLESSPELPEEKLIIEGEDHEDDEDDNYSKYENSHTMAPMELFDKLLDSVSEPFPVKIPKNKTQKKDKSAKQNGKKKTKSSPKKSK